MTTTKEAEIRKDILEEYSTYHKILDVQTPLLPLQFLGLDHRCSCQNISSNPAVNTLDLKLDVETQRGRRCSFLSPDHSIQIPVLTSCHCAKHRVV